MSTVESKAAVREEAHGRRLQDELLFELIDHAPDAIAIIEVASPDSERMHFVYANQAFESLYDCRRADAIGSDVAVFFQSRSLPQDIEKMLDSLHEGRAFINTRVFERSDGRTRWLEINFRPVYFPDQPARWIFVTRDITAKKLLQDRATQLSIAVADGDDCVAISVADEKNGVWRFSYVNEALSRTIGFAAEEIVGKPMGAVLWSPTEDVEQLRAIRTALFSGKTVRDELPLRRKDGSIGYFEISNRPVRDPFTKKYTSVVTIFRDVTERKQREQVLRYEADHDLLTGLFNRRHLERELIAAANESRADDWLLFVDLDGFKDVNDRLGHEAGDDVLRSAAEAFKGCCREGDVLSRWGGDEFAVLLRGLDAQSARETGAHMLRALHAAPDRKWVTASLGLVRLEAAQPLSAAIRHADRACYAAKAAGGDRVVVGAE